MIECMRLIIGEVGTREREREGLKVGRSERSRTQQSNLGGREGTAVLGSTRGGRSRRLPTPPAAREVTSLHSNFNSTPTKTLV